MSCKGYAIRQLDVEDIAIQSPFCGDFGVKLPQGACRGVSGIGKQGFPFRFLPGIEPLKALFRHKHLAAYNQTSRRVVKAHGNGADGFQILCHILTHISVPSRSAPDKLTVHIFQSNGQAVDFRLYRKLDAAFALKDPVQEIIQLLQAEYVLQAH